MVEILERIDRIEKMLSMKDNEEFIDIKEVAM